MRVLALDTSTAACSAAIWDTACVSGHLIAHRYEPMDRGQSEALAPMIHEVLRDAGAAVREMDLLAVTTGPGAFTGVRIGLAMARSLGMSASLPVLGVSTMEAVAHGVPQAKRAGAWLVVVMDTKRDDVYVQTFDPLLAPVGSPEIILPDEIMRVMDGIPGNEDILMAGDAAGRVVTYLRGPDLCGPGRDIRALQDIVLPDAAVVAAISAAGDLPTPDMPFPTPIYLRPPYAKISLTGGKLRP